MPSMRYLDSFATPDCRTMVLIAPGPLKVFAAHRQFDSVQLESGGILLGRRRGAHFEIVHATGPFPTDTRRRFFFQRESAGHQEEAVSWWASNNEQVDHIGEWHTHSQSSPQPSTIDLHEWTRLVGAARSPVPMLAIIVGTSALYIALVRQNLAIQQLVGVRS